MLDESDTMKKIAVSYTRYSSDNQREESILAQNMAIDEYAERSGVEIVKRYSDRAVSGTSTDNRVEFMNMIGEVITGTVGDVSMVLVHKNDRFARNIQDAQSYKSRLKACGVDVIAVNNPFDDSPVGFLGDGMMDLFAAYYSKNLSHEVRKGFKANLENGYHNNGGKPPLGYKVNYDTRKYEVDEENAPCIRMIFDMFLDGISYEEIARTLNAFGFRTGSGRKFTNNKFYDILTNHKYLGIYSFGNKKKTLAGKRDHKSARVPLEDRAHVVYDAFEPIVEEETFFRAQALLKSRKNGARANAKMNYVLSSVTYCAYCGSPMYGGSSSTTRKGEKVKVYRYRCSNKQCKDNKTIKKDYLEEIVLDKVNGYIFNDRNVKAIYEMYKSKMSEQNTTRKSARDGLQKQIDKIEHKIDGLLDKLSEDVFESEVLQVINNKIKTMRSEKERLVEMMESTNDEIHEEHDISFEHVQSKINKMRKTMTDITDSRLRLLLQELVRVNVSKSKVELIIDIGSVFSFGTKLQKRFEFKRK